MIQLDHSGADSFLDNAAWERLTPRILAAHQALLEGSGAGNEWLGWRRILADPNDALLQDLSQTADEIRRNADVLVCIGIGGSYIGAKAIIDARRAYFENPSEGEDLSGARKTEIIFAGHNLSGSYLKDLLAYLEGKSVYVCVISKSGTTLEPALAFRYFRLWMENHFGDAEKRIITISDATAGVLHSISEARGYRRYVIPSDIGGRFSVLSPAGLLPIAASGIDIRSLFYGAVAMQTDLESPNENPALSYAGIRYSLMKLGYTTEVLALFEPCLAGFGAWWQQLFGESEGKNHTGVFPTVALYSTDLHSLGQYMQEGRRNLFETFLVVDEDVDMIIPPDPGNLDELNHLSGKTLDAVNRSAYQGTASAHEEGGVPNVTLRMDALSDENLGRAIYFFQHAASVGGYLLGVNPFDQPGVEAYKKGMMTSLEGR